MRDLSKSPSIGNVGSKLDEIEYSDDCEIESEEDAIFTRAFLYGSLEDIDNLDNYKNIPLDEFFLPLVNPMDLLFILKIKVMNLALILK
jgi:hypothetical protein